MIVNPLRRTYDKAIHRLDHQLGRRRNRITDAVRKKQPTQALTREVRNLQNARDIVEASCRKMATHCLAGDLDEVEQLDALTAHERLLLDVIRIIAYRAETRMMLPVMQAQGHKPYPRKLLQALLTPTPTSSRPHQWRPPGPHSQSRKRRLRPPDRCGAERHRNDLPRHPSAPSLRHRRGHGIDPTRVIPNQHRSGSLVRQANWWNVAGWKSRQKERLTSHFHREPCAGRCEAAGEALASGRRGPGH